MTFEQSLALLSPNEFAHSLSGLDPMNPLFALMSLGVALMVVHLLTGAGPSGPSRTAQSARAARAARFESIDGLRGYLAFFVFVHHAAIWYFYIRTGQWTSPPSNLFTHFGHSSVSGFFMITGFLFFSKILQGRTRDIDWTRLFVGRVFRLVPLYFCAIAGLYLIIAFTSTPRLIDTPGKMLRDLFHWLLFTIYDSPDINGVPGTKLILSGVTWSLAYEWFFYLSLPILALLSGARISRVALVIGSVGVLAAIQWKPSTIHLVEFGAGIAAAFAVRHRGLRRFARSTAASVVCCALIATALVAPLETRELLSVLLLSSAFILVAAGANLFGLLTMAPSRALGELAYGIYLLHGMMLFVLLHFIVGYDRAVQMSAWQWWAMVAALGVPLVIVCQWAYQYVERPTMRMSSAVTRRIRSAMNDPGWVVVNRQRHDVVRSPVQT